MKICKNILIKMDMSNVQDIGEPAKIIFESDIPKFMKTLSKGAWITRFPNTFIELLNDKNVIIEVIKYTPHIYFYLGKKKQKDKKIIKETIKSFKNHNKISEINTHTIPLTINKWRFKNGTKIIKNRTKNIKKLDRH